MSHVRFPGEKIFGTIVVNYYTGMSNDENKVYISGEVSNPNYFKGSIDMTTMYYDSSYNMVGQCANIIKLLGKGYSVISFSCHIEENEMMNNKKFNDIAFYKIRISDLVIDN